MLDESPESPAVSCPECGGDVCVLKQLDVSRFHRSRVASAVLWSIFLLILASIWVWNGAWESSSRTATLRTFVGSEFRTAFVPWYPIDDESPVYLSSKDMHRAILGNEASIEIVQGTLQTIIDRVDAKHGVAGLEGVRFSFKHKQAHYMAYSTFSLAGGWVSFVRTKTLLDIRDVNSIDKNPVIGWEKLTWDYFPRLTRTRLKSDTTNGRVTIFQYDIYYLTITGVLSICMLGAWGIRWAGRKIGLRIAQKKYMWSSTVAVLMGFCMLGALLNNDSGSSRSTVTSQSTPISQMYSIETLRESVLDASKLNEWCTAVLDIIPPDQDQELLLGQLWVFDSATSNSSYEYTADSVEFTITDAFPLARWGHTRFGDHVGSEDVQSSSEWFPFRSLLENGTISMLWGTSRQPSYMFLNVVNMALIVVSLYWLWAALLWISRLVLIRIQKRRVRRDQCIFCRYPLTEEGRNARSAAETT